MDYSNMFSVPSAPPPPYEVAANTPATAATTSHDDTCISFAVSTDYEHQVIRADRKTIMESNNEFCRLLTSGVFKCTNGQYEIHCKTVSSFELYIRWAYQLIHWQINPSDGKFPLDSSKRAS